MPQRRPRIDRLGEATRPTRRASLRLSCAALLALSLAATPAGSQAPPAGGVTRPPVPEHTAIEGVVTGRAGAPVRAASIRIAALAVEVRSDSAGGFILTDLPAGTHLLDVRAIGYRPVVQRITLALSTRTSVRVRLTEGPPVLETVRTVAGADRYRTGFQGRMARRSGGHFLTNEQIRASGQTRVTDLLRRVPGLQLRSGAEGTVLEFGGRGSRTFSLGGCPVAIAIDGAPYELAFYGIDGEIGVDNVEAIEVYDAATAPAEFSRRGAGCGLILIWTRERAVQEPPPAP